MGDSSTVTHLHQPTEQIGLKVEKNSRGTNYEISMQGFTSIQKLFSSFDEVNAELQKRLSPSVPEEKEVSEVTGDGEKKHRL